MADSKSIRTDSEDWTVEFSTTRRPKLKTSFRARKLSSHSRTTDRRGRRDVSDSDEQRRGVGHQTNDPSYVRAVSRVKCTFSKCGDLFRHGFVGRFPVERFARTSV